MIPWIEVDRGLPGSEEEILSLHRRGDEWSIRSAGVELMNSRRAGSERALAERSAESCADGGLGAKRVLVGGLGLGHTASAALEHFPVAKIVVAEVSPKVIEWNRGDLGALSGAPLADARCEIVTGDVLQVAEHETSAFDAILLDVDNGPEALSRPGNASLYSVRGLRRLCRALVPGGFLAVWSAGPSEAFEARLRKTLGPVETHRVSPRSGGRGRAKHTIWVAQASIKG